MKSKTFLDENSRGFTGVFLYQLRRALAPTVFYAVAVLAVCLISIRQGVVWMPGIVCACMALALPGLLNGPCFSRGQADLIHALPVGRGQYFRGTFLASLLALELPLLAAGGIQTVLVYLYGHYGWGIHTRLTGSEALYGVGVTALLAACCLAFFTLAAVSSGTYLGYAVNSVLLSVAGPALSFSFLVLAIDVIPGVDPYLNSSFPGYELSALLSPAYGVIPYFPGHSHWGGSVPLWLLGGWALFTLLLLFLGERVYRRRAGEATGSFTTSRGLETALRVVLTCAASLFTGYAVPRVFSFLFYRLPQPLRITLTLLAMVLALWAAWLLLELLFHHGLKGSRKRLPTLLASAVLTLALTAVISTGMGADTAFPQLDEIDYAEIPFTSPFYLNSSFSVEPDGPQEEDQPDRINNAFHKEFNSLNMVVYKEQDLRRVKELQEKWIQVERANQFPYLPGRRGLNPVKGGEFWGASFHCQLKGGKFWLKNFWGSDRVPDRLLPLAEEYWELSEDLLYSEDFVKGAFPLCAIDAAEQIGKTGTTPEQDDAGNPYYQVPPDENPKSISSLENSQTFRKELEAALLSDLTQGRWPLHIDGASEFCQKPLYEIVYTSERDFTARGGLLESYSNYSGYEDSSPAQGKALRLSDSSRFLVWPEMTETYALLEKAYS